ncbi:MAG: ABC-2 family transporter protein [Candidatus Eisenbacteria bacterium]|uniref:ABC-2 family transporter protein n=1 Tax=Eiseniibacteriota bacterium TaxID=2212470 RepID=A0A956LZU0_UNCEI|nr:ABC-2 family transporter protein [Candidatus Eisenbacteria bacterium]
MSASSSLLGIPRLLRKTVAVAEVTVASQLAYVGEQLVRTIFLVLILYTFTQLWNATNRFQDVEAVTGLSIAQLIWYLVFTESILLSAPGLRGTQVDEDVKSGDLAYRLAKPIPYPFFQLGADVGSRVFRFAINLVVGCLVALVVVGPIRLSPLSVAAAVGLTLTVFVADWVWIFSISLLSFWVEDTFGLHLLYRRLLMLLGGMLLPLEAYPEWLAAICRKLPFAYLVYHPSRLFVQHEPSGFGHARLMVLLIGVVGLLPLWTLYRFGLRRVSAQGG